MSKTDNTAIEGYDHHYALYGIIAQIVCLIIPGDHLRNDSRALIGWLQVFSW